MDLSICCISPDLTQLTEDSVGKFIMENPNHDIYVLPEYYLEVQSTPLKGQEGKVILFGSKVDKLANTNTLYCSIEKKIHEVRKIKLTPWEDQLNPGTKIFNFEFKGAKCAILICFDIEFPELAVQLKKLNIDLLIVPAATETAEGYYRVSRCASSRSIELGCAVVTCHLIGNSNVDVVDINVGNNNLFLPAQSLFKDQKNKINEPVDKAPIISCFKVPITKLKEQRKIQDETNPALR